MSQVYKFRDQNGRSKEIHMNGKEKGVLLTLDSEGKPTSEQHVVAMNDEFITMGRNKRGQQIRMKASDVKKRMAAYGQRRCEEAQALRRGDFEEIERLGLNNRLIAMRDQAMLLDLGIADVHQAAPLPNVALGYHNEEGLADVVSPVIPSAQPSAKYYQWNEDDAFQAVDDVATAPGGDVPEITPRLSNVNFSSTEYAVSVHVPTEVQAAADSPLQPYFMGVRRCLAALAIAREQRIVKLVDDTTKYDAQRVLDLTADPTTKWNGGSNSNPVRNIQQIMEAAAMEPTGMAASRAVKNWFTINAAVQKFTASKTNVKPIPDAAEWSALLELPKWWVGKMKVKTATKTFNYVWGNDLVLFRTPPGVPSDGMDASTAYSYRWNGGVTSDGEMQGGYLVRGFFDMKRGPRGGMTAIVTHQDADILTSNLIGGVIKGCIQ
jgi:hypothetical protein